MAIKFCSEIYFQAWGSFTSLKSQTRDPQLKVPPGGLGLRLFTSWKNPLTSAGFKPTNLGSRGEYITPRAPRPTWWHLLLYTCYFNFPLTVNLVTIFLYPIKNHQFGNVYLLVHRHPQIMNILLNLCQYKLMSREQIIVILLEIAELLDCGHCCFNALLPFWDLLCSPEFRYY